MVNDLLFLGTAESFSKRDCELVAEGFHVAHALPRTENVGHVVVVEVDAGFDLVNRGRICNNTVHDLRSARDIKRVGMTILLLIEIRLLHFRYRRLGEDTLISNVGRNHLYLAVVAEGVARGAHGTIEILRHELFPLFATPVFKRSMRDK